MAIKNWMKSVLKPFVLREILDDIKKIFVRVWNLRFSIFMFVLFCMVVHLYVAVGNINKRMKDNVRHTGQVRG